MFFGIDLGTTNSLISVFQNGSPKLLGGASPLMPSVVSILDGAFLVGAPARERLAVHPKDTVAAFKRSMGTNKSYRLGRKSYSAVDLSAMVLAHLREQAQEELGVDVREAVISVPAYFNQLQRDAVRDAALAADLKPTRLINEPTAAAVAYGLQDIEAQGHILVFDLGGGTFDVSIIEVFEGVLEVKATSGDAFLGGEDFTQILQDHFAKTHDIPAEDVAVRARLRSAVETLKHALSQSQDARCDFSANGQNHELSITRDGFAELAAPLIKRLRLPVERALYDARLSRDQIDRVVLVGGATRMPLIRAQVARMTGKLPEAGLDPDHVVALGASIQAALTARDSALDDVVMTDVSAFSLGFAISKDVAGWQSDGFFQPVIERNTVIPASREEVFSTAAKGQTQIDLELYQGEAPRVQDNVKLGKLSVKVPRNTKDFENVAVRLSYDISGLIEIDATVLSTGKTSSTVISNLTGGLSDREVRARRAALQALKHHPKDDAANIALTARLERCYAMALDADRHYIQDLLLTFEQVLARQNPSEIAQLHGQISEQLDQFEANYVR